MENWTKLKIGVSLVIIMLLSVWFISWWIADETDITVKKMYIDNSGSDSHYMIVDTSGKIWEMDAVWTHGSFGIDRLWGNMEVNHTYHIHYCGYYIPALDEYSIIYDADEINTTV